MTINQVPGSNVQAIDPGASRFQGVESTGNKNEALGNVRPSKLATAGRILLGICTLGISEGIRYFVNKFWAKSPSAPRINQPQNPATDNASKANASKEDWTFVKGEGADAYILQGELPQVTKDQIDTILNKYQSLPTSSRNAPKAFQFEYLFRGIEPKIAAAKNEFQVLPYFTKSLLESSQDLKEMLKQEINMVKEVASDKTSDYYHFYKALAKEILNQLGPAS